MTTTNARRPGRPPGNPAPRPNPRRHGSFKIVNWNLGNGQNVDAEQLRRVAREQRDRGVTVFGLNEFSPAARKVWTSLGYRVFGYGSNAVAYDPDRFRRRRGLNTKPGRVLTKIVWHRPGGAKVRGTMTKGLLIDKATGHRLRTGAIHTPAGVQHRGPSKDPADRKRLAQLKAMMTSLGGMVRGWMPKVKPTSDEAPGGADAVAICADDNSDETKAPPGAWDDYTGRRVTGLRQLQPPRPTHGGGRGIDPMYIRGLEPLHQWVTPNPSDHHLHGAELAYKNPPKKLRRRVRDMVKKLRRGGAR